MIPKPPLPPFPLKRRRLPERSRVTIAAGFSFSHGTLLCADTEITHGWELKSIGSKILPFHFASNGGSKVVFTFSGAVHYAKMAVQQCVRALAACDSTSMGRQRIVELIAEELHKFHVKHIYKHPLYMSSGGPDFNLIFAAWSQHEGAGLYETSDEAVIEVTNQDMYALSGSGSVLAKYVVSLLVRHPFLKLEEITTTATHMLAEVKRRVPGCGGHSELLVLHENGDMSNVAGFDISHVISFGEHFHSSFWGLFLEACDPSTPDKQISERFDMFRDVIDAMREQRKKELEDPRPEMRKLIQALSERKTQKV
jgi:20S proteasome alpha/beta subunit